MNDIKKQIPPNDSHTLHSQPKWKEIECIALEKWASEKYEKQKKNNSNDNARIAKHMQWKNGMAHSMESLPAFTDESGDA